MYQHSVEHSTEGETTHHEPEHGEDTIARVKGTDTIHLRCYLGLNFEKKQSLEINECFLCCYFCVCFVLLRPGEGSSEEIPLHSRWSR